MSSLCSIIFDLEVFSIVIWHISSEFASSLGDGLPSIFPLEWNVLFLIVLLLPLILSSLIVSLVVHT